MTKAAWLLLLCLASAPAIARDRDPPAFFYDDLRRFAATIDAAAPNLPAAPAIAQYVANGSPAYPGYVERYDVTPESIAKAVAKRPLHYRRVSSLEPALRKQEGSIARAMARLNALLPGIQQAPPIYYLVGNMYAGGIQVELNPPVGGHQRGVVLLLEALSMAKDSDMSEWPGTYSGGYLEDIPQVAVHESVHVYQFQAMGPDNYTSIYKEGTSGNVYLALAVREGCADYLTLLATGKRRRGTQHAYGLAHEAELWGKFQDVMYKPASFGDGWFGALDPKTPDWPPQIGYWLGSRMCQAYHEATRDKAKAFTNILNAYRIEDLRPFADAYARKMAKR